MSPGDADAMRGKPFLEDSSKRAVIPDFTDKAFYYGFVPWKTGKIYKIFNDSTNDYSKLLALNFFSEITLKTIDGIDEFSTLYKN